MKAMAPIRSEVPTSDDALVREPLHVVAGDAGKNREDDFVAFKETHRTSGTWRVRVDSRHAKAALLYPNAMRLQARATSAQGKPWFTWSDAADARAPDARQIMFRVHVSNGLPAAVEILPGAAERDAASGATGVLFFWPAA